MLVYHGGIECIEKPDLAIGRADLDFGKGFYLATLKEQAEKWALRKKGNSKDKAIVSMYDFDENDLNILRFDGYSLQWLNYITTNRIGRGNDNYDAVFGFIADDDVADTVARYQELVDKGRSTETAVAAILEELTYSKPNDQYCIKTIKALENLRFLDCYEVD